MFCIFGFYAKCPQHMYSKHPNVVRLLIDGDNGPMKWYSAPKIPGCVLIRPPLRPSSMPCQEYVTANADAILHEMHEDAATVEAMETDTEGKEGLGRKRQENGKDSREASIIFVPQIAGSESKVHVHTSERLLLLRRHA